MPTSTVTSNGQVTLPRRVLSHLGLKEGDRLDFVLAEDGSVQLLRVAEPVCRLYGMLHRAGAPAVMLEEIDEVIAEHVAEDDARIRSGCGVDTTGSVICNP